MTVRKQTRAARGIATLASAGAVFALAGSEAVASPLAYTARQAEARCSTAAIARVHHARLDSLRHGTICLVNAERAARGLPPLRPDRRLRRMAGRHALDMVRRGYFSHRTPTGGRLRDRVRASGYGRSRRWRVGENLAWGRGARTRPYATVAAWMASPPHRDVILSRRYRQIGIAIVRRAPGGPGATYVVELGSR